MEKYFSVSLSPLLQWMGLLWSIKKKVITFSIYYFIGQTVEELHDKLTNKLNIHSLQLIEDLDPAYEGLVSFACGNSKRALPVFIKFIIHFNSI